MSKRLRGEENNRNSKPVGFFGIETLVMSCTSAFSYITEALGFNVSTPVEIESMDDEVTLEQTQSIISETKIRSESFNNRRIFRQPATNMKQPIRTIRNIKNQEDEMYFLNFNFNLNNVGEGLEQNFSSYIVDSRSERKAPRLAYNNEKEALYTPYKADHLTYGSSYKDSPRNLDSSVDEERDRNSPETNLLKLKNTVELYNAKNNSLTEARKKRILEETRRSERKKLTMAQEEEAAKYYKDKNPNKIFITINNIDIHHRDILRTGPRQWLNDEIINCYMSILNDESKNPENGYPKVHCFNTFFYVMLLNNGKGYNYQRVAKWTKTFDVFLLDFLIMPIHMNDNHWCLAVINIRDKRVEYYDSMGGKNMTVVGHLRHYISDEHKSKKNLDLDMSDWIDYTPGNSIPQQDNIYDCGVFMCQFAESIASGNSITFVNQDDMPYYRKRMLLEIMHNNKRFDSV